VLTDEDEAEYRSFEALIETKSEFKQSTVMHLSWCLDGIQEGSTHFAGRL